MKKIELIWREILSAALEKKQKRFVQKELASKFGMSTSTVFQALKKPRRMGALKVGGRGFELVDFEKLLFYWATVRDLKRDIIYKTFSNLPIMEIEGLMPGNVIPTAYTAYRFFFKETPADYDRIYFYSEDANLVKERFPKQKKREANIFLLKADPWLSKYKPLPLVQIFVDLWNLSDWYAKEYQNALLQKMYQKLGL